MTISVAEAITLALLVILLCLQVWQHGYRHGYLDSGTDARKLK